MIQEMVLIPVSTRDIADEKAGFNRKEQRGDAVGVIEASLNFMGNSSSWWHSCL